MKQLHRLHSAFTMIELVFVIVILGIVASIGAEVITQTFESYIVQRAQYRANIKTELALNQIANRLRYAIPGTIGARKTLGNVYVSLDLVTDPDMKVLQWVGYDGDSFEALNSNTDHRPGWSGFCDINASSTGTIQTPGSDLSLTNTIIGHLGGTVGNAELYFAGDNGISYGISSLAGQSITMDGIPAGTLIPERYKLAWSSYALAVVSSGGHDNLLLYYNFTPKTGTAIGGSSQIMLRDVTNFRFKYSGGAFRLKICKKEPIGANSDQTVHACKEKVVF